MVDYDCQSKNHEITLVCKECFAQSFITILLFAKIHILYNSSVHNLIFLLRTMFVVKYFRTCYVTLYVIIENDEKF